MQAMHVWAPLLAGQIPHPCLHMCPVQGRCTAPADNSNACLHTHTILGCLQVHMVELRAANQTIRETQDSLDPFRKVRLDTD